jgi:hypothetical protein
MLHHRSFSVKGRNARCFSRLSIQFNCESIDHAFIFVIAGSANAKESKIKANVWNEVIVNRSQELLEWSEILGKVHKRKIQIYTYANNHYAVYAPPTVEMFQKP